MAATTPRGTADTSAAAAAPKAAAPSKMRPFAHNTPEDYYDHAMADFPVTSKIALGIAVVLIWVFTKLVYPWKIEAAERLAQRRGRVIIMNHESMLDPVAVVATMWFQRTPVRIVYKSEFDQVGKGIVTWAFARVGGFPVNRGTADMKVIRRAKTMLQRGESILIFPEGTRVKDDDASEVHGGYALMADLAKAPVQPTAIVGARKLRFRKRSYLAVGECIEWDELDAKKRKEKVAQMERVGMERVFALRDALREEHPGAE